MGVAVHLGQWRLRKDQLDGLCGRPAPRKGPAFPPGGPVSGCRFPPRNPSVVADGRWVFRPVATPALPVSRTKLRESTRAWLKRALPQEGLFGLAIAVWLGDASCLPEGMARLYREGGLLHLLALSGQHVASLWLLVHAALALCAGWANQRARRRVLFWTLQTYLPLFAAAFLVILNPGNEPMARAAGMLLAFRFLRARGLSVRALQVACSSLALLLVFSPSRVASDSFALSGIATLLLCVWLENNPSRSIFATYFGLAWAMPVLLLPVSAFFFGQVAWTAPVNSWVVGWTWSLIWVPLGFLLPLLSPFEPVLAVLEIGWGWFAASNAWATPWVEWGFQPVWRPTWIETLALEGLCVACVLGRLQARMK
jgi:predicted membrane metal-binding protein